MKKIKKIDENGIFYQILNATGVVVNSDNNLPYQKDKKKKLTVRIFRDIFTIFMALFILFGFTSFFWLKNENSNASLIQTIEIISFFIFLIDWIIHWIVFPTRDVKRKRFWVSYLRYLTTANCFVLFITLMPSLYIIKYWNADIANTSFGQFLEALKAFKVVRILRLIMLLNIFAAIQNVAKSVVKDKAILINIVIFMALILILFAVTVWYTETTYVKNMVDSNKAINGTKYNTVDEFYKANTNAVKDFPSALYFCAITLTTIGYGDIIPFSPNTRMIIPLISIVGISIIAAPGGIIAGSVLNGLQKKKDDDINSRTESQKIAKIVEEEIEQRVEAIIKQREIEKQESKLNKNL